MRDALHATGPDLLCNTRATVHTRKYSSLASLPAPIPARPRPCRPKKRRQAALAARAGGFYERRVWYVDGDVSCGFDQVMNASAERVSAVHM